MFKINLKLHTVGAWWPGCYWKTYAQTDEQNTRKWLVDTVDLKDLEVI